MPQAYKDIFQFARESTWQTPVASDHRLKTYNLEPEPKRDVIEPELSDGTLFTQEMISGVKRVTFTQELPLTYTGLNLIWDCIMGTATYGVTGGATTGAGPYLHTFKIRELLNSLTLQAGISRNDVVDRMVGAKVMRAVASLSADQNDGRLTLTWMASDWISNQTPTAGQTAPTLDVVMFKHLHADSDDGLGEEFIKGVEISIDNGLLERDFGAEVIAEPIRGGRPTVTLSLDKEYNSLLGRNAHWNMTEGAPRVKFTSGTKIFDFTMPRAILKATPTLTRRGLGPRDIRLVWSPIGDNDGSYESYGSLAVQNDVSTILAG